MRVTVLANGKGGCGKTTLATTLASALAVAGRRVALADADPQRASLTWLARRPADAAPVGALDWTSARAATVRRGLRVAETSLDWLIVDAPADLLRNSAVRKRLAGVITRADSIIAPATPSIFDAHATRQFLAGIEAEACGSGADAAEVFVVANRVPKKDRRGRRDAQGAAEFAFPSLGAAAAAPIAALCNRAAYRRLAEIGLSLFDSARPNHAAIRAEEWRPLLAALAAPGLAKLTRRVKARG